MITLNDGTVLRNLEEQVLENKQQIALHWNVDRVLADFGIHVLGRVNNKAALDQVPTDNLQYGDAYLVGTAEPYEVWIWTRPDENAGKPTAYFLNIGHIAIEGPQGAPGEQGPAGPAGERGSTWSLGSAPPANPKINDMWLQTSPAASSNGRVLIYTETGWVSRGNITGPQGPEGPKGATGDKGEQGPVGPQGPQGDVGGFINIKGILTAVNQLPNPATLMDLTAAYLIGTVEPYDLYIQVGQNAATATWHNTGPFNAATAVSVGGVYQNVWDADTKVDKPTDTSGFNRIIGVDTGNNPLMYTVQYPNYGFDEASAPSRNGIPIYVAGQLGCATPTADYHAANKRYVDTNFVAKQTGTPDSGATRGFIYGMESDGTTPKLYRAQVQANPDTIPLRNPSGTFYVGTPTIQYEAVNKQYVDDNFVAKYNRTAGESGLWFVYVQNHDGVDKVLRLASTAITGESTIPFRDHRGALPGIGTPTKNDEATNKAYVDNAIFGAEAGTYDTLDDMVAAITDGDYTSLYEFLTHLYTR